MFDFSKELIHADIDNVLKDIATDIIFGNTLHTQTPPTNVKKGDYILLNYNGLLCYLINNNNDPYIVLSTKYIGLGVPTIFEDIQELMEYAKNTIIKDIKFLYNTYIADKNIYILNTYNTENESTNISIIIAQLIISLYKDLKIKPVFLKNTNLVGFDGERIIEDVNDNIKTLYLDLNSIRVTALNNVLYTRFNKVINACNPTINTIIINSNRTSTKIYDKNKYFDYLKTSKFKGNIKKGTGAIIKYCDYISFYKGLFLEEFFTLYSYDKIIFNITDYYLGHFQMYTLLYEKDTINKYTSSYNIISIICTYYNLSYNQVKEDIILCYNILCDKYYKAKVQFLYIK